MADPWAAWEALLSRLSPNGVMKLGFYSQIARHQINQLRDFIAAQGFGNTPEAIRACRRRLIEHCQSHSISDIFLLRDFYSTNACRDLLFLVQEHQLMLPKIKIFLESYGLSFIGFETDSNTLNTYRQEFSDDPAANNLSNWHDFEQRNPKTLFRCISSGCKRLHKRPNRISNARHNGRPIAPFSLPEQSCRRIP